MAHLPVLISDLAMILLVAGITTLIFKKLNQPLVLGYIIAGFLTGPHFNLFPTISDMNNIATWAEIGVIFLLFALGLEFSFNKLKSVGKTAMFGAFTEVVGLLAMGFACGKILGWNTMDSIFLGGMLSMSSTTIIIKAFDDLKLRGRLFTQKVFGILIVEDIAGIIMMVMLSTLATTAGALPGYELLFDVIRLLFFLVLWFLMGVYLVPSFFKKTHSLMNDETLLVVAVGLCLGMVVLATNLGFSAALGAFIMGSLIAESYMAERAEHVIKPVQDLFGAVFFVSVGMMVDHKILIEHALPILAIILTTIVGKLIFTSLGVLLSGQSLNTSLHCGFSLAQIGEFSFIIASLGMSLGVLSDFIYPIIVAVSVITTFTTPYFIKISDPACEKLVAILPKNLLDWLNRYTSDTDATGEGDKDWATFLGIYVSRLVIYLTLLISVVFIAIYYLQPYMMQVLPLPYSKIITAIITLIFMSPFLRALLENRGHHPELFSVLWFKKRTNHLPLLFLITLKIAIAFFAVFFVFTQILDLQMIASIVLTLASTAIIASSDWLLGEYLRIESRFLINLNEKQLIKRRESLKEQDASSTTGWLDEKLFIVEYNVEESSYFNNKMLSQLTIREHYGVNILKIVKDGHSIDMPGGNNVISAPASMFFIGTADQVKSLSTAFENRELGMKANAEPISLRDYVLQQDEEDKAKFLYCTISINATSPLLNKSIKATDLRDKWNCLVIGLERGNYTVVNPNISLVFEKDDLLWVLGKQKMINQLVREEIL
ncbi:MAG TPA: cation:proton antiporter [Candidatus Avacidaminococcus intestinavium]|uniref:Cation:proton antiporter n=1 Tax=Candidatus Avacidaminococcus intestinavium TaxID=2840684 RepID=A0A9D1MP43_9FIRM|nr:cation:proton antiporter [Candidatus Avacidaminococcus intestinavium]